jgi:hypothetical protein
MIFPAAKKTLWQLLGPSIIFVALSLNGGEMLLWPDLVGRYSLTILWAVPLILFLQFMVNLEIERYSIVTGKNTLKGMIDRHSWLGPLFIFGIIISLAWPAWISIAGNIFAYTIGFGSYGAWFALVLLGFQILIWQSKKSYQILENIARFGLLIILTIGIYTLIRLSPDLANIKFNFESGWWPKNNDRITFVSALAFGGVAGVLNLVQSDWVSKKGYGINQQLEINNEELIMKNEQSLVGNSLSTKQSNIVNRETSADLNIVWNEESVNNFKNWWSLIWKEHFILFYLGNFVGIFLIAIISAVLLPGSNKVGFGILTFQVDKLNQLTFGAGFAWALGIFLLFFMAQMTILDATGRLLKNTGSKVFSKFKSERLSQLSAVIGMVILLFTAIIPGFNQPAGLLQISATTSAFIMALYPIFLLKLNLSLPNETKPRMFNILSVLACVIFYGVMVVLAFI